MRAHGNNGGLPPLAGPVVATLLLGLAGYLGYVLYPRFDLPAVTGAGIFILAAAAGVASFFSPCSFPLLLTLLVRDVRAGEEGAWSRALRAGLPLAAGAGVFLTLLGLVIALGGAAIVEGVTFGSRPGRLLRAAAGILLIVLGLIQLGAVPLSFHRAAEAVRPLLKRRARLQESSPAAAWFLLGFFYLLAGFG
ncbi:MAG: hypothetical protein Kow00129_09190 [Thermoleophilia bacterium]